MKRNNRFSFMTVAVAMTALFVVSCNQSEKADDGAMPQIRVGVFNGNARRRYGRALRDDG